MRGRGRPPACSANPAISSEVSTDSSPATTAGKGTDDTAPVPAQQPSRAPQGSACEPYRELIVDALGRGRNATAIWQDLVDDHGFPAGYASVRRFVSTVRQLGDAGRLRVPLRAAVRTARRGDPAHQHAAGLRHADENYVARAAVARAHQERCEGSVSTISSAGSKRCLAACAHSGAGRRTTPRRGCPARWTRRAGANWPVPTWPRRVECRYHGRNVTTAEMALLR